MGVLKPPLILFTSLITFAARVNNVWLVYNLYAYVFNCSEYSCFLNDTPSPSSIYVISILTVFQKEYIVNIHTVVSGMMLLW